MDNLSGEVATHHICQVYLTQSVYQLVLESQLSHKTVNLIFQLVIVNNKLTIVWGS